MTKTLQTLAAQLVARIETRTRTNGHEFLCLAGGSPEWMEDAICTAHDGGEILPQDMRYRLINEALELIAEAGGEADGAATREQLVDAIYEAQGPVYPADLFDWLQGSAYGLAYCDQAMREEEWTPGDMHDNPTEELLRAGWRQEFREVGEQLLRALDVQLEQEA